MGKSGGRLLEQIDQVVAWTLNNTQGAKEPRRKGVSGLTSWLAHQTCHCTRYYLVLLHAHQGKIPQYSACVLSLQFAAEYLFARQLSKTEKQTSNCAPWKARGSTVGINSGLRGALRHWGAQNSERWLEKDSVVIVGCRRGSPPV